ncbi:MAG: helicase, partial [Gemmatimonadetes bacterium]|nr:helicase [Gemmatimonadota bacterium]
FDLVLPAMLGRQSDFLDLFDRPIAAGGEAGAKSATMLHERIRPYLMRRLKTEVLEELPPRTEVELPVELLPGQARLYTEVLRTVRGEVFGRVEAEGIGRATIHVLAALTRLRQIACDPRLLGDEVPPALRGSAKLQVLKGMLPELVSEGHAALIFSQFTSFLDHVETVLEDLGLPWLRLDGSTPTARRPALVGAFQAEDGPPLFLIGLRAGGTGLNLTRADYVFHLDPWWNPAVEDQATDRAHRIGQTRPVVAYRLVASGTVESRIRLMQERKRHLAAAVLGGDDGLAAGLDREDLELLFSE